MTSFDNIFLSFLTIFQTITMEGWVDSMYFLKWRLGSVDGAGEFVSGAGAVAAQYYFVLLIWVGSFFVMNLVVAVIYVNYAAVKDASSGDPKQQSKRVLFLQIQKRAQKELERLGKLDPSDLEIEQMREALHEAEALSEPRKSIIFGAPQLRRLHTSHPRKAGTTARSCDRRCADIPR